MKRISMVARRIAALVLAVVLLCTAAPAAFAEGETAHPTTMGGADTTLIPAEEENCLSWLFGSRNKITLPYLNIKGKGLRRNVTLNLVDCLVGITYTELGSIGSFVSASAAQQAWKAQAVAIHSYLLYHKQYGSSANALIYTPVDEIPSSTREALRKAIEPVKDEVVTYNGSVIDAVWSASAGYNTQTGTYGTCSGQDAWGSDVPYLQSVESPYEEQYHNLMRRIIGRDYRYTEYTNSKTGQAYQSADTTHKGSGRLCAVQHPDGRWQQLPVPRPVRQLPLLLRFRHRCQWHPGDVLLRLWPRCGYEPMRRGGLCQRAWNEL